MITDLLKKQEKWFDEKTNGSIRVVNTDTIFFNTLPKDILKRHKQSIRELLLAQIKVINYPKYIREWEKSLSIHERFSWATEEQKKQILSEIKYQREQGGYQALSDLQAKLKEQLKELE